MTALRKCAWCGDFLEKTALRAGPVTHGICDPCLQKFFPDKTEEILTPSKL